jgi:hypothetical protein
MCPAHENRVDAADLSLNVGRHHGVGRCGQRNLMNAMGVSLGCYSLLSVSLSQITWVDASPASLRQ